MAVNVVGSHSLSELTELMTYATVLLGSIYKSG